MNFIMLVFVGLFSLLNFLYWGPLIKAVVTKKFTFNGSHSKQHQCKMLPIDYGGDMDVIIKLSYKPKILICTLALIFLFYVVWMYKFSLNFSKKSLILSFRRNIITMKTQTILTVSILLYLIYDQLVSKFNESFNSLIGPENAFKVWWTSRLIEKIVFIFVKNSFLLYQSYEQFPELFGLQGRQFPDQEKPRQIRLGFNISSYNFTEI